MNNSVSSTADISSGRGSGSLELSSIFAGVSVWISECYKERSSPTSAMILANFPIRSKDYFENYILDEIAKRITNKPSALRK